MAKTLNIITSHFLPEQTACTNRLLAYCKALPSPNNINIISLTEPGVKGFNFDKKPLDNNVEVSYIKQRDYNRSNFFIRAVHELYYAILLCIAARKLPSGTLLVTVPYMFLLPVFAYLGKGKKILDIRDLVWEYLPSEGFILSTLKKLITRLMLNSISKFDLLVVTNTEEYDYVNRIGFKGEIIILPNGISQEKFNILSSLKNRKSTTKNVLYIGNVGFAQNLDDLISSAKETPNLNFIVIGDGGAMSILTDRCKNEKITNVSFLGKKRWEDILFYYESADILYAGLNKSFNSAMPSKLYEYASTGKVIVFSGAGIAAKFVNSLDKCKVVPPGQVAELTKSFKKVITEEVCVNNISYIESNFIREKNTKRFYELIGFM